MHPAAVDAYRSMALKQSIANETMTHE